MSPSTTLHSKVLQFLFPLLPLIFGLLWIPFPLQALEAPVKDPIYLPHHIYFELLPYWPQSSDGNRQKVTPLGIQYMYNYNHTLHFGGEFSMSEEGGQSGSLSVYTKTYRSQGIIRWSPFPQSDQPKLSPTIQTTFYLFSGWGFFWQNIKYTLRDSLNTGEGDERTVQSLPYSSHFLGLGLDIKPERNPSQWNLLHWLWIYSLEARLQFEDDGGLASAPLRASIKMGCQF